MANGIEATARRLLNAAYHQRDTIGGAEELVAPHDVAPDIGFQRFSDEVDRAIEHLERNGYVVDTGAEINTTEGMFYRITPRGLSWLGLT